MHAIAPSAERTWMPNADDSPIREGDLMAAVDLGSNSFHLVVARYEHGEPRVIDRLRDSVRLAAGLKSDGSLDQARLDKALACLASTLRFFADGKLSVKRWQQAQTEISVELQQFAADYKAHGWVDAIGSSGTIRAIGNVLQATGWSDTGITRSALEKLRDAV